MTETSTSILTPHPSKRFRLRRPSDREDGVCCEPELDRRVPSITNGRLRSPTQILAKNPGVAGGDSQQGDRWPLRNTASLLPIAERVHADAHRSSKLCLCQPRKAPKRCDVFSRLEAPRDEPPAKTEGDGASKISLGQSWNVPHCSFLMYARN